MNSRQLVQQMTLEEKASLCSGRDFWSLKAVERLGLPSRFMTDGPHGVRRQAEAADQLGVTGSLPATCFPAACTTACSFDEALLEEIGAALGEECLQQEIALLLGPGINIKRSPLCGRNFEYFSEDPYLSGRMGAALIRGVQSKGVGTALKHFAANNQEKARMVSNSVLDERTLREIYLAGFEHCVKQAAPWAVMCAYNLLNGAYCCENKVLLTDILRQEWGFGGLTLSDWGASSDRVKGLLAGLDLEMPGTNGSSDAAIVAAVQGGRLNEAILDEAVTRIVEFIQKAGRATAAAGSSRAAHHALAQKAAAASCVLLQNQAELLPLSPAQSIAVIGAFAQTPRYQGAGSSKVNPTQLKCPLEELQHKGFDIAYAPGYSLSPGAAPDPALIQQAAALAANRQVAVIFAGLPEEYESEGFDRASLDLPPAHNRLIEAVAAANPNTVVVLQLGAPVAMPWAGTVKTILATYLGGQAGAEAVADILSGAAEPGGRLAESWPKCIQDTPCYNWYPGKGKTAEYREGIFVGYRYYDTAQLAPAYPFGHGLGYTRFAYSELLITPEAPEEFAVTFKVTNIGKRPGSAVPQVYISKKQACVFRPLQELKGFTKLFLEPGKSQIVTVQLNKRSFAYYNTAVHTWCVESGFYEILVGASSRDIQLAGAVSLPGDGCEAALNNLQKQTAVYYQLPQKSPLQVTAEEFAALYGGALPPAGRTANEPFTINSTLGEIEKTASGKLFVDMVRGAMTEMAQGNADLTAIIDAMLEDIPLRGLSMMGGGAFGAEYLQGLLFALNGQAEVQITEEETT